DRNYFNLAASRFTVQENTVGAGANELQPWVAPSFDYAYTLDRPVAGGELNIDVNAQNIYSSTLHAAMISPLPGRTRPQPGPDQPAARTCPAHTGNRAEVSGGPGRDGTGDCRGGMEAQLFRDWGAGGDAAAGAARRRDLCGPESRHDRRDRRGDHQRGAGGQ